MLIAFSRHHDNPSGPFGSDRFRPLTDYFDAAVVMKTIGAHRERMLRDPAPEVLRGHPLTLRRAIATVPFARKYSTWVLSFAPADIDVADFNRGDVRSRRAIELSIELVLEMALAGIPRFARPPLYVTTHTHTGRLEVNVAMPHAVLSPDAKFRSINPDPPMPGGGPSAAWTAVRDILNIRFGWADPQDPARQREFRLPDWLLKRDAEAERAGIAFDLDPRLRLASAVGAAVDAGQVTCRAEVEAFLAERG
ncbi:MAG: hypothetical protein KGI94_09310, partial [Paracoccaceae bacterium]|nr:hypothetical protein [Paracoccaceae bacterium]